MTEKISRLSEVEAFAELHSDKVYINQEKIYQYIDDCISDKNIYQKALKLARKFNSELCSISEFLEDEQIKKYYSKKFEERIVGDK